jgi:hypothetical protein
MKSTFGGKKTHTCPIDIIDATGSPGHAGRVAWRRESCMKASGFPV